MTATILTGNCVELMQRFPDNFFDSIVTDPPYGLEFMGKGWDSMGAGSSQQAWHFLWAEQAFRILKPGGHILSFGGTRTYHRMASAVEDAGFEIRDMVSWLYGQGFPKSMNVGKAIDKALDYAGLDDIEAQEFEGAAEQWEGWGTALKPAQEPIVLARKPLIGTVAKNVLEHGTGALNIDATRIEHQSEADKQSAFPGGRLTSHGKGHLAGPGDAQKIERSGFDSKRAEGRWPANVILTHHPECVEVGVKKVKANNQKSDRAAGSGHGDEDGNETVEAWGCHEDCAIDILDTQTGTLKSGAPAGGMGNPHKFKETLGKGGGNVYEGMADGSLRNDIEMKLYGDSGGASRFFYVAKASKKERNAGLDDTKNSHPTVKPIALMRYLIRLVTPPNGRVLDPFTGSGTTGIAAVLEDFDFVGFELDPEYVKIARARIKHWKKQ